MKYLYIVIRPDDTSEAGEVNWPANPSYDAIAKLVGPIVGGPIERVRILDPAKFDAAEVSLDDYRDMFVDEMGHMREPPGQRNDKATWLYRANWLRVNPDDHPEELPFIAGVAVVFDRAIWR